MLDTAAVTSDLLVLLAIMLAGGAVGWFLRDRSAALAWCDRLTNGAVYALLFLIGISVGTNEAVLQSLGALGLQAFVLGTGAVVGSVILVMLFAPLFSGEDALLRHKEVTYCAKEGAARRSSAGEMEM